MRHLDDGTLQAWLDEERAGLSPAERDDVERHLAACAECAARLEALAGLDGRARALLGAEGAGAADIPDFERVVERAGRGGGGARRRPAWTAAAWAATVVLAVAVGWLVRGQPHRDVAMATARAPEPASAPAVVAAAPSPAKSGVTGGAPAAAVEPGANESGRIPPAEPRGAVAEARPAAPGPEPAPAAPGPEAPLNGDVALKTEARRSLAEAAPSAATLAPGRSMQAARAVAGAAAPAVVRGRVTDESGRPLAGAQVVANGTGGGVITDAEGSFSLPLTRLPADSARREVSVTARLLGYAPASRSLPLPEAADASMDIRLSPESVALNAIVVAGGGDRDDTPASPASRAVTYRSAAIDANGDLAIVTDGGATITVRKEADQTSFSAPVISSSRAAVGARAMFPSCCTSYDLPLQLVVYAAGKVHRFTGVELPIFRWAFEDGGTRVAYGQEPAHFGCTTHYELRDVESERLIETVDVPEACGENPEPKPVKTPPWVAELMSKK